MKVALVCDDLIQKGGHEKVVMDICRLFPEAPLYTTMATKDWQGKCAANGTKLITSFMQKFPFKKKLNRFYAPFLFYVLAIESFDFTKYDLVISISSRFAHGIITKPSTMHICYMSTVGRMIWEPDTYFEHENFKGFKKVAKMFLSPSLSHLRIWDFVASKRPDSFITNSKISQQRIRKYYNRESIIIHPAIDTSTFLKNSNKKDKEKYFFVLTRLASWKKVEIAIKACLDLGLNLKIAGDGPDRDRLENIAKSHHAKDKIEFLGYTSDQDKIAYLKNSEALIVTQFEDFGITPLEAMACGTPVIAYRKGGVLETVVEKETGIFFDEQTAKSLKVALSNFSKKDFDSDKIVGRALKFDINEFNKSFMEFVNSLT